MKQKRFREIEKFIAASRKNISDGTRTAHAIDRNDGWGDIGKHARIEGYNELADLCEQAETEWFVDA